MLLLFSIVSVALGVLLVLHPFDAAVSVVMLCGILLIAEGALNLGCILYAAMELRTLDRMASAAANAALGAIGDAWTRPKPPSAMSAATALWCTTPRAGCVGGR